MSTDTPNPSAPPDDDPPRRGPGRPRTAGLTDRVLDAARELFDETGWAGFSIAEIERRTGIGKPTIYRRWPTIHALLFDALFGTLDGAAPLPDTGSAREDIRLGVRSFVAQVSEARALEAARAILVAQLSDEATRSRWEAALDRDRRAIATVFERGRERGEALPGLPPMEIADMFLGWAVYRCVVRGDIPTTDEIDAVVSTILP